MNSDCLHVDLPATVIKDSVSDAMIVQKEDSSDSNPWENVDHNDRLCLEATVVHGFLTFPSRAINRVNVGEQGR